MSHVISHEVVITDIDALVDAVMQYAAQGAEFVRNKKSHNCWVTDGNRWMNDYHGADAAYRHGIDPKDYGKCDHVIRLKGVHYEIGVVKVEGGWRLACDFWGTGRKLMEAFGDGGENLNNLMNEYQHQLARRKFTGYGVHKITSQVEADKWNARLGLVGARKIAYAGKLLTICVK